MVLLYVFLILITILVDSRFHDSYIFTMVGAGIEFFRVITNLLNNVSQSERQTYNTILPFYRISNSFITQF